MKFTIRIWTEALTNRQDDASHLLNIEAKDGANALRIAEDYLIRSWFWTPQEVSGMRYTVLNVEEIPRCAPSAA